VQQNKYNTVLAEVEMKLALVDESGGFVGPPPVSNEELRQLIAQTFENMQSIYLSAEEMTRCLSVLENLIGTTGFLLSGRPWGRLTVNQTADLGRRLKELSDEATQRIETEPAMKDLVVQLRFLTAHAASRNLALWLVTED
jgi:hypothetical protein